METSLQSANLTANELDQALGTEQEIEEEHHIHLPSPSLWPLILSIAIAVAFIGLLFIPDSPWLTIVAAPFILVGILGWALEDPMASHHEEERTITYTITVSPQQVLEQAREVIESMVTIGSRAWSAHPVKVEAEGPGVMALYGKVELSAQRAVLEDAIRQIPGVLEVRNFIVAEDEILDLANARLEKMQASGKLEGAKDLSILAENYILHLYGDVPDQKMKYALEREMIGIPGVTVVVNHIGLNTDIPGNLGRTRNKVGG
jgi:osmotically-inducible protein OsmY